MIILGTFLLATNLTDTSLQWLQCELVLGDLEQKYQEVLHQEDITSVTMFWTKMITNHIF